MKIRFKHLTWLLIFFVTASSFAGQNRMRFVELQGEFLGNLKYAGNGTNLNQYSFGGSINVGNEYVLGILEYNYRKVDMSNLKLPNVKSVSIHEFYLGARYYPMRPTVMVGNIAVRLTAGAMGGLDLEPNLRTLVFCGLAFSPITSTTGLTIDFVYRPGAFNAGGEIGVFDGYMLEPCWMIRVGIILGPSLQ